MNCRNDDYNAYLNGDISQFSFMYKGRHGGNFGIEAWKFVNYLNHNY